MEEGGSVGGDSLPVSRQWQLPQFGPGAGASVIGTVVDATMLGSASASGGPGDDHVGHDDINQPESGRRGPSHGGASASGHHVGQDSSSLSDGQSERGVTSSQVTRLRTPAAGPRASTASALHPSGSSSSWHHLDYYSGAHHGHGPSRAGLPVPVVVTPSPASTSSTGARGGRRREADDFHQPQGPGGSGPGRHLGTPVVSAGPSRPGPGTLQSQPPASSSLSRPLSPSGHSAGSVGASPLWVQVSEALDESRPQ